MPAAGGLCPIKYMKQAKKRTSSTGMDEDRKQPGDERRMRTSCMNTSQSFTPNSCRKVGCDGLVHVIVLSD
ncbi:hypothetical protein CDL27_10785 [Mediterraneibacter gnavus]|nr:hypothetical protein CDL27_10785 [Mediterraneibacter gnavus]